MYKHVVLFLVAWVALAQALSFQSLVQEQWESFKLEHGKFYQSEEEEQYRQSVFMENLNTITKHNELYEMGLASYKMAINHLGDLTSDEFINLHTAPVPPVPDFLQNHTSSYDSEDDFVVNQDPLEVDMDALPTDMDWSRRGAVTPVKNQGQCGSCWSFSATGTLEGQWFKKTHKLVSLSEQNLLDCSGRYGNHGCKGGWPASALKYVHDNGGIDTEGAYPYRGRLIGCHYNRGARGATVAGIRQLKGEGQLLAAVTHVGPISVTIQVIPSFHHYHSGVYYDRNCGNRLNHAVLVVGYGREGGYDYWLVKNSWGTGWGNRGYIKMARNRNNQCGIADWPVYPLV